MYVYSRKRKGHEPRSNILEGMRGCIKGVKISLVVNKTQRSTNFKKKLK